MPISEYTVIDTGKEDGKKKRNREETRTVKHYPFQILSDGVSAEWGEHIRELVLVERIIRRWDAKTKEWEESHEDSFYLSTICLSAERYGKVVR